MQKISKVISVPIAAQIAILPIMIKNFNTISFTFLISNIIAMPLLGICIIGGYLLILLSFIWLNLAQKVGILFNIILKVLILIAKFCGNLKLSNIYVITPNTITIIIYYIMAFLVIYYFQYSEKEKKYPTRARCGGKTSRNSKKANCRKIAIIVLVLIIIIEIPYTNYNGKLKIYFIDVGQRR